jgi:hypothetical protein
MSIESMAICLHHSKASGSDKLVLLGIANHDGDGGSWPAIATLAKYANISERGVQKCLERLVGLGEVAKYENMGGNINTRLDRRPNRYVLLVNCPNDCDRTTQHRIGVNASTLRGERQDGNGVNASTERGELQDTLTILKPSYEPSINLRAKDACNLLADLIQQNGSKRPVVTDKWIVEMDKLNRIDGRSWEQINAAIDWCQNDAFWRGNVLSPAKLRKQYDQLRLQALREQKQSKITKTLNWMQNIKWDDDVREIGK